MTPPAGCDTEQTGTAGGNRAARWLIPAIYMVVLFVLGSVPDNGKMQTVLSEVPATLQNVLHAPVFGLLAILWAWALGARGVRTGYPFVAAGLIAVASGALLEVWQFWIPGRFPSLLDAIWDTAGVVLTLGACWLVGARTEGGSRPPD